MEQQVETQQAEESVAPLAINSDKDVVTRTLNKELDIPLTNETIVEKAKSAAEIHNEISKVEAEFDLIKKQYKAKIDTMVEDMRKILDDINKGKETKVVDCIESRDYTNCRISYSVDGKVVEERAMQGDEFQKDLFLRNSNEDLNSSEDKEMDPVEGAQQVLNVLQSNPDRELQDVMRAETSVRTKHSSVDGPTSGE